MKRNSAILINSDKGFALIGALLILTMVAGLGLIATRNATIESQIAGHDKFQKMTWFATEAYATAILPQVIDISLRTRGYDDPNFSLGDYGGTSAIYIGDPGFAMNGPIDTCEENIPSEGNSDVSMGKEAMGSTELYSRIWGQVVLNEGNAIQLPEGYEGIGKGLAGGGAAIEYTFRVLGLGIQNSRTAITTGWRHVI